MHLEFFRWDGDRLDNRNLVGRPELRLKYKELIYCESCLSVVNELDECLCLLEENSDGCC